MRPLKPLIDAVLPALEAFRHDLHRHPELAYQEHRTAGRVLEKLQALPGLEIREGVAGTSNDSETTQRPSSGPSFDWLTAAPQGWPPWAI